MYAEKTTERIATEPRALLCNDTTWQRESGEDQESVITHQAQVESIIGVANGGETSVLTLLREKERRSSCKGASSRRNSIRSIIQLFKNKQMGRKSVDLGKAGLMACQSEVLGLAGVEGVSQNQEKRHVYEPYKPLNLVLVEQQMHGIGEELDMGTVLEWEEKMSSFEKMSSSSSEQSLSTC